MGLGITLLIALGGIIFRDKITKELPAPEYIGWLLYLGLLSAPLFYLFFLGNMQSKSQKKYEKIFKDIGFIGKDGKYPYFCGSAKNGKKQILIFKSNIPLADWQVAKGRLETALDYNILKMEYGNSKKIVKITVLPADFEIPKMITWDDAYLKSQDGVITIGQSALESISFNLNRVPHVLVAGKPEAEKV